MVNPTKNNGHDDETTPMIPRFSSSSSSSSIIGSIWSSVIFGWYTPVLENIQSKIDMGQPPNIEKDEGIPPLPKEDCTAYINREFETLWKQELNDRPEDPSLMRSLLKAFWRPYIVGCLLSFVGTCAQFIGPVVLNKIIPYLLDPSSSLGYGLNLTMAIFLAQMTKSLCLRHSYYLCSQVGIRVRTALMFAIFKKALQIDSTFYRDHPSGHVTNLMSVDVNKIAMFIEFMIFGLTALTTMILAICMLWQLLGFASLAGLFFLVLSVPVTTMSAKWMGTLMKKLMKVRDDRINCNQEILTNMNIVKMQAWEDPFRNKTEDLRKAEVNQLFKYKMANAIAGILYNATPMLVAVSSFGVYVTIAGHSLDAATALTVTTVFSILKYPLMILPNTLNLGVESLVALRRIQNFLMAPNVEQPLRLTNGGDQKNYTDIRTVISMKDATFSYQRFKKETQKEKKVSLKSQLDNTEHELLLVKAKLADVEEHLADLEDRPRTQYGSTYSNADNPNDVSDGFKKILPLRRVNFECNEGEFVAIVGGVGSGKSTLLKAILGEVQKVSGESRVRGKIAYFGQNPFIMNDTVKGNILFGKSEESVDDDLYQLAVRSACLEHDLKLLSAGDQTEIGEKGINLSGGQKARVAIGRAVYRDADISLLDDCLSAVDAHVGRDLFDKCIVDVLLNNKIEKGSKRKRTVILVTNALQYLSHSKVDRIVVLKDGLVVESGSYSDLVCLEDSQFKSYLDAFNESMGNENKIDVDEEEDVEKTEMTDIDLHEHIEERRRPSILSTTSNRSMSLRKPSRDAGVPEKPAKLMTDEAAEGQIGKVEWEVYTAWLNAAGGLWVLVPLLMVFAAPQLIDFLTRWWLADIWGTEGGKDTNSQLFYLAIYALLNLVGIVLGFFNSIVPVLFGLRASKKFFSALLDSMLTAPMSFFETTPTGRILNRFSKDINTVDEMLISNFMVFMGCVAGVLTSVIVLVSAMPQICVILPFLFVFYKQQHAYFSQSNRELKRIESTCKSPVYALFGEALNGYCTIRAFEAEPALLSRITDFIDKQQHATYLWKTGNCWLGVRLEFVGTLLILFGCLGFVFKKQANPEVDQHFASIAGLALTYLLTVTGALLYAVRMSSDFEANLVSVERIREYTHIEKEAPHDTSADKLLEKDWPSKGSLEFKDLKLRYRPGLPLVLKGLNITIPSQAKVGIVGRTGAGKSTLMNALMRLVEPAGGKIILDGVDIATVGLTKLRSNIAVIPQDPVLFSGSVRTNIDPFNQHSEDRLMDVLGRVGLYGADSSSTIKSLEDKVEQDGSNFSAGQRQLLVIARALLDGAAVVICDEATSSIDAEADSRIQRIFRTDFAGSTTLSVAHRLNTIMDSTHILAMSDGKAIEFDTPSALLAKGGLFKGLVDKWEEEHE